MNYNYTAYYKTDEERIKAITEDILREYPNLGRIAIDAAKLEKPFGRVHEDYDQFSDDENHINRLIDIVIVTEGKPEFQAEYKKACEDLLKSYSSWRRNFTYANPEEQSVYLVMQKFNEHSKDKEVPLITVNQADEVRRVKYEEQQKKEKWKRDHTMQYNYTAYYKTDEERINAIAEDILREYPNLGRIAIDAAKLEKPFGRVHEDYDQFSDDENHINRLIDIVIVTEGKPEFQVEYKKACEDLLKSYNSWRRNFTYANPEEQAVYLVMQRFNEHMQKKEVPLITINQATIEQRKVLKEKELRSKADRLRNGFPKLGKIADEVIKLEDESGIWIRWVENDIIRLVTIIKLTEDRDNCAEIYSEALERLKDMYPKWLQNETKWHVSLEQQMVIEMMNRLNSHLADKNIPISTYAEIKEEFSVQKKSR